MNKKTLPAQKNKPPRTLPLSFRLDGCFCIRHREIDGSQVGSCSLKLEKRANAGGSYSSTGALGVGFDRFRHGAGAFRRLAAHVEIGNRHRHRMDAPRVTE